MPWTNDSDILKSLPAGAKAAFIAAANAALKKNPEDEATAIKIGWGAVKKAGFGKQGDKWVKLSESFTSEISDVYLTEKKAKLEGRNMTMVLAPKKA